MLVVPDEERIPAKMHELREYGGDKLVVCFDPEDGSMLSLEVAYKLARARVLMARGEADGVDAAAIREAIERATGAMGDVLRVKQQLTGATTSIRKSAEILDSMAVAVRAQLMHVELLLAASEPEAPTTSAVAERERVDGGVSSARRTSRGRRSTRPRRRFSSASERASPRRGVGRSAPARAERRRVDRRLPRLVLRLGRLEGEADADLAVAGFEQVGAVPGALHPQRDDVGRRALGELAPGEVLADEDRRVAGVHDPRGGLHAVGI